MSYLKVVLKSYLLFLLFFASGCITSGEYQSRAPNQAKNSILVKEIVFESEGVTLAGSIYDPKDAQAAVVLVHGSDPVPRMTQLAEFLAKNGLLVLTYDKRGVGESGGVYVCLLYTSPSPRDLSTSRMPSSA